MRVWMIPEAKSVLCYWQIISDLSEYTDLAE